MPPGVGDHRDADRSVAEIRAAYAGLGPDRDTGDEVRVSGELRAVRRQGGLSFAVVRDVDAEIQLFVDQRTVGRPAHRAFDALHRGDRVTVRGTIMTTRRGELSIRVAECVARAEPLSVEPPPTGPLPFVPVGVPARLDPEPPPALPPPEVVAPPPLSPPRWPVRLVAGLTALTGVLELLGLLPSVHHRFGRVQQVLDPTSFVVAGRVLTVLVGLGLLLLADQLAKRKRAAWRLACVLFALSAVAHLIKGPHLAANASLVTVLALVATRDKFRAAPDPPSLLRLARFVPTYLGAVLLFGLVNLYVERAALRPAFTVSDSVHTVFLGLIGLNGPYTYLRPRFAEYFSTVLIAFGVAGLVVFAVLVFRPLRARGPHTEADWRHALRLVHTHGWDTLAYFALRDDKSFFFGSDGEAMLAYTYSGGYALVAGNPIGAPESVPRVLDEFLRMCDERAWNPAFLAIRQSDFPSYAARGFRGFYLGDEAILRCPDFDLAAAPKSVRAAVRRVGRRYRFVLIAESGASPELVGKLNAISARWRGKAPERGFTMSLSQDIRGAGANQEFLLCLALDEDDQPGGFLRLVPAYGRDPGYTLDLMRHDPAAPNGMTEFLVVCTAQVLRQRGVGRLSMNFAMWGRLFADDVRFGLVDQLARRLVAVLNPFFQIRSLRRFNAKFNPEWLPRMLAYRRPSDLPRVGLLYAAAEGFLAVPLIGDLLVPKAVGGVGSPSAPSAPAVPSAPAAPKPATTTRRDRQRAG